ncbi:hypothetical protein HED60_11880 [Planctomycetales bacterium ZRK34]|nr:hypothetical protein HED60_11880 [Planctomycetales bacterium ZRK34]
MLNPKAESLIRRAAKEVQPILDELYANGQPSTDSPLNQCGLRDGFQIISDYLAHGEIGLALGHLLYMVSELALDLPAQVRADIHQAAKLLGVLHPWLDDA